MWTLEEATEDYSIQKKWFAKKLPREYEAMILNLGDFVAALNAGSKPMQAAKDMGRSVSVEPSGVFAMRQQRPGTAKNLRKTRLYVYPDPDSEVVHLLTIGDEQSQPDDIQYCSKCVSQLNERKATQNEQKQREQGGATEQS